MKGGGNRAGENGGDQGPGHYGTMSESRKQEIWPSATGITDLSGGQEQTGSPSIPGLRDAWASLRERMEPDDRGYTQFWQRLGREWSIETGVIEDLYWIDPVVTQTLIELGFRENHLFHGSTDPDPGYALRLCRDHQEVLDGVAEFAQGDRQLSLSYIREMHAVFLRHQMMAQALDSLGREVQVPLRKGDWKVKPNYPTRDGVIYTYCPPEHVAGEMERLLEMHRAQAERGLPGDVRAAWLHHRFAQIHPFQDGNGRVARTLASLVLLRDGLLPLVITRDDRPAYIKALEAADDGDLKPLIDLSAQAQAAQLQKATRLYEEFLQGEVRSGIDQMRQQAHDKAAQDEGGQDRVAWQQAKGVARLVADDIRGRLEELVPRMDKRLGAAAHGLTARVEESSPSQNGFARQDTLREAERLGHHANLSLLRLCVYMILRWPGRSARLVFSVHGLGQGFDGQLACTATLALADGEEAGDDGQDAGELIPITDSAHIFSCDHSRDRVLGELMLWREEALDEFFVQLHRRIGASGGG